jgi:hypothetical protein
MSSLGLDLLLLLDHGLGLFACYWRYEIISLRQSQPSLRHVGEGDPCIAVFESGRQLEALLGASPILVCPYPPRPI